MHDPRSKTLQRLAARFAAGAWLAAAVSPAWAQQAPEAPAWAIRWSGFGTLGLTHHNNDSAGAIFTFSQRSPADSGVSGHLDTVLGLQADATLLPGTTATVQAVTRAGDNFSPELRMAFLRQQLGQDFSVRVGRIRSPLFLDSDVSEIGFAYLLVRPALPVYSAAGNYMPHLDGGDLQWRHSFGGAAVMIQASLGNSANKQVFYNTQPQVVADTDLRGVRGLALSLTLPQTILRVSRTWFNDTTLRSTQIDQLNAGVAQASGALNGIAADPRLPASARAALSAQASALQGFTNLFDGRAVYSSIGFDSTVDRWRLMSEWTEFESRSAAVGKYKGFSANLGYTFGEFTPYIGASRNNKTTADLDTRAASPTGLDPALDGGLAQLQAGLDQTVRFANLSTRSRTLGIRWDVRDNVAAKLQLDRFQTPSSTVPGIFAVRSLPIDRKLNMVSVTVDFVF